eukprot:CAMPEP_0168518806 /NCGR_PEP_ID=MMETSP0405-20121227/6933_1 /TAXON_ID=498012 /ORGANISM="Trichosphaerium sp, Strain Am-I-7 wt" /LENGTH=271 /DNA_ID=CAMNT_0008539211 /DNA_START=15 /DNA_END=830 /DNA_ORIENTATION=+
MANDDLDCALDLMRRLPPGNIEDNLAGLIDMVPDLVEDLLSAVDQPLKIAHDQESNRDYLLCDYNRDGDSYRSPWSNKYDPFIGDGNVPSKGLRELEVELNDGFDIYRDLYFEGGVSSVYCWDLDGSDFAACILIKKTQDQSRQGQPMKGTWDSIHVVEVEVSGKKAQYKLTSTVMLGIETETKQTGTVNLAGSLTRQDTKQHPVPARGAHVKNIGKMVEEMEIKLRMTLNTIYFGKTKDIVDNLRSVRDAGLIRKQRAMQQGIGGALGNN